MIEIENLVKTFQGRSAVNGLTLSVNQGESFALLGPNGAGKTTTIRILTMLLRPTSGKVAIGGHDLPQEESAVKELIGVVPQHMNLDSDLTARENLQLHARLHHMDKQLAKRRIDELLAFVELEDRANDMVGAFSGGMKRRLMIARAVLHNPQILFLDEPTVGLDPQVRRRIWELIRRMHKDGLTLFLTTHYIEEAEQLCERVAIVDKGKLLTVEAPQVLCRRIGEFSVEWMGEERAESRYFATREAAVEYAAQIPYNASIRRTNLEDVFVEMTGRKVRP